MTQSSPAQRVLSLCDRILAGDPVPLDADNVLCEYRAILQASRGAFQEATVGVPWRDLVSEVLAAFDGCLEGLDGMPATAAALKGSVNRLRQAIAVHEARKMVEGPSAFPIQNALIRAVRAVRSGDLAVPAFIEILVTTRGTFEQSVRGVRLAPDEPAESRAALESAFTACSDVLSQMEVMTKVGDLARLEDALQRMEAAQQSLDDAMALQRKLKFEQGPTSSPQVNIFVAAAGMVRAGQYPVEVFARDLDALDEHVRKLTSELDAAAATVSVAEQIPLLEAAVQHHHEGLAAYRRAVTESDPTLLDAGSALLLEGVRILDEARANLRNVGGVSLCPRCGEVNEGGATSCAGCHELMPGTPGADVGVTDHLKRVWDDVNRVASGRLTPPAFAATLDWMDGLAAHTERELAATPDIDPSQFTEDDQAHAEHAQELIGETKELLAEGIAELRASLAELRCVLQSGNPEHLSRGLRMFWQAGRKVSHAQSVGQMGAMRLAPEQSVAAPQDDEDSFDLRESVEP